MGFQKDIYPSEILRSGQWIKKQGETTFFPEYWSKRQTAQEIESAFKKFNKYTKYRKMDWIFE